jgi:hypothetical protein
MSILTKRTRDDTPIQRTPNNAVTKNILTNSHKNFGIEMGSDFWNNDSFASQVNKKTKTMDANSGGIQFGSIIGNTSPFLQLFKAPGISGVSPKQYPQTSQKTNYEINTVRMVKKYSSQIEGVSPYELSIYYRSNVSNNTSFALLLEEERFVRMQIPQIRVEDRFLFLVNIQTWNMIAAETMFKAYKKNKEEYFNITHDNIFNDWAIDGVVRAKDASDKKPPYLSHKYTLNNDLNETTKVETNIVQGQVKMLNYIGNNIHIGDKLWLIIKKFNASETYHVSYSAVDGNPQNIDYGTDVHIFKPLQMAIIARMGEPSHEDLKYTDERGDTHYGKKMFMGTVLYPPPHMHLTSTDEIRPCVNAKEHMGKGLHDFITLIFNGQRCRK